MLGSRVRHVSDMGFPQIGYQSFKLLAYQRLHEMARQWEQRYPGVDIVLIEPEPNDELMFQTSMMNFTSRVDIARHGFESVTLKLAEDYGELRRRLRAPRHRDLGDPRAQGRQALRRREGAHARVAQDPRADDRDAAAPVGRGLAGYSFARPRRPADALLAVALLAESNGLRSQRPMRAGGLAGRSSARAVGLLDAALRDNATAAGRGRRVSARTMQMAMTAAMSMQAVYPQRNSSSRRVSCRAMRVAAALALALLVPAVAVAAGPPDATTGAARAWRRTPPRWPGRSTRRERRRRTTSSTGPRRATA